MTRKRGYSRNFTPHGQSGKRYMLDAIPAGLWADVKTKAAREGISLRALILELLADWKKRTGVPNRGASRAPRSARR